MSAINTWPEELKSKCVIMAAEKKTSLEIAITIKKSRNAVIGFCRRHGIPLLAPKRGVAGARRHNKVPTVVNFQKLATTKFPSVTFHTAPYLPKRTGERPLQIERYSPEGCRFIHGEPREYNFCCQPIWKNSYCEQHYRRCYQTKNLTSA